MLVVTFSVSPFSGRTGYIFRLVGKPTKRFPTEEALEQAAVEASKNLEDSFWVVGVVEQYPGFQEVLKRLLDPANKFGDLWEDYTMNHRHNS